MSLSGFDALISLESARLESARQTSSNFQSVGSTIQQQGVATAQSKSSLVLQKIDGEYTKSCAEADVRRLESKLVRERKAEKLALATAAIVTGASALSNLWDAGNDLFNSRQKLGQVPDYMKSPNVDASQAKFSQSMTDGSTGGIGYISGPSKGGSSGEPSETVYSYQFAGNGSTSGFRSATITDYDKMRVLGPEYAEMKNSLGHVPSFAEIQERNPKIAEKLMADKMHDMSSDEASDFMKVFEQVRPQSSTMNYDAPAELNSDKLNAEQMAALSGMVNGKPNPAGAQAGAQLAAVSDITNKPLKDLTPQQAGERLAALRGADNNLITNENIIKAGYNPPSKLAEDAAAGKPEAKAAIEKIVQGKISASNATPTNNSVNSAFVATKNKDGSETLQRSVEQGVYRFAPKVTSEDKKAILGPGFEHMSLADIYKAKNGPENIDKLMNGMMKKDDAFYNKPLDKNELLKILGPDGADKLKDFGDKMTLNEISAKNPDLAAELSQKIFGSSDKDLPDGLKIDNKVPSPPNVHMITSPQATNLVNDVKLSSNAVPALKDGLKAAGKYDDKGFFDHAKDVAKAGVGVLVNTAQAAVPYFQAYMAARDRADNTQDELKAAMDKLAAANRKLKALEQQIDVFGGRGA